MLLHLCVILFTEDGGGGVGKGVGFPACITGHMTRGPTGGSASRGGLHAGKIMQTPHPVCLQGGLHLRGLGRPPPPQNTWDTTRYGQQAGGTHPTGIYTGYSLILSH